MVKYVFHIVRKPKSNELFGKSTFPPNIIRSDEETHSIMLPCNLVTVVLRGPKQFVSFIQLLGSLASSMENIQTIYHSKLNLGTLKLLNLSARFVCWILAHGDLRLLPLVLSFGERGFCRDSHSTLSSKRGSCWHSSGNCQGPLVGVRAEWSNHNKDELLHSFSLSRFEQEAWSSGCPSKPDAPRSQLREEPEMTERSDREKRVVDDTVH